MHNQQPLPAGQPQTPVAPLAYHRLLRGIPNYRWWKPLVFGLLALVFGFSLTQIVVLVAAIPLAVTGGFDALIELQDRIVALDTQDPFALAVALLSLVVWIPAILLAAWAMGFKPVGRVWSVTFRLRMGFFFKTLGPAVLSLIFAQVVGMVYAAFTQPVETVSDSGPNINWVLAAISLVLVLILVPLQAAAEELMFRGAMMQVLGAWIKNPTLPILIPSVLFAFGHLYDPWGLVQVGLLGAVAGYLTWRTGGLEAAISLHVVNNLVVFVLLATGVLGTTSQPEETGSDPVSSLIQMASFVLYAWLVILIANRSGIARTNMPQPQYVQPQYQQPQYPLE